MPGTNHETESSFMDELPMHLRDAASDALRSYRLKQLLEMRKYGPNDFLKTHYTNISSVQWMQIFNAALLTKVSYFKLDTGFSVRQIDKLFEIILFAQDDPESNIRTVFQSAQQNAPFFANWIQRALSVRKQVLTKNAA